MPIKQEKRKAPKRRRPAVVRVKDRESGKHYPASVSQTVLAIQQYWLQEVEAAHAPLSVEEFMTRSEFAKCFQETTSLYPGLKKRGRTPKGIAGVLRDLTSGAATLDYYKLRCLARFTGVRAAGLFLFFTQLVGEERRARSEGRDAIEACRQLTEAMMRVAQVTINHLDKAQAQCSNPFTRQYDATPNGDLPDVAVLRAWRDAVKAGNLPPDAMATPPVSSQ